MGTSGNITDLANYRLRKATESLGASKLLFDANHYSESINRSYYTIFNGLRALLAYEEFDSKRHSGIIAYFNKHFVKTGKFAKEYSIIVGQAFRIRNKSDYDDFYIASRQEAAEQLEKAEQFLNEIKRYIATKILSKLR